MICRNAEIVKKRLEMHRKCAFLNSWIAMLGI